MSFLSGRFLPVLLGFCGAAMQAQTLVNGGFEIGTDPNSGAGWNLGLTAPDNTTITGWMVASGTVDYIGIRWQAGEGGRSLDLSGVSPGSIVQEIGGFTPGMAYEVSFLLAANPEGGDPIKNLRVDIGGTTGVFASPSAGSPADPGWERRSLGFTAGASVLTLSFTSLDNGASGPALDGVRITAVPEPSAPTLLGLAIAAGFLWRFGWKRRLGYKL